MELLNGTRFNAAYSQARRADGRESIVVVVKGSFDFTEGSEEVSLSAIQNEPLVADEFTGLPGESATRMECDFAPEKPLCDILVIGSAHAPAGRKVTSLQAGFSIGSLKKTLEITGHRKWEPGLLDFKPGEPEPFSSLPISYDFAYGGTDTEPGNPAKRLAYAPNPVGTGYYPLSRGKERLGKPLPTQAPPGQRHDDPEGACIPVSFGPVGRNFPERLVHAGTYDQHWLDEIFPDLPADFNSLYHQAAPADQQIPYPQGGETVSLVNLTPSGRAQFRLPRFDIQVEFTDAGFNRSIRRALLDTVTIDADAQRLYLVWRASLPLKRNMIEMRQVVVGQMSRAWYRAREHGKKFYPSLAHLVGTGGKEGA
jgi:hypothetical protein